MNIELQKQIDVILLEIQDKNTKEELIKNIELNNDKISINPHNDRYKGRTKGINE